MTLREILVGRSPGRSLIRGCAVAAVLLAASRFVLTPVRAHGISMMPTYDEGQLLLCYRLAYTLSPPRRGDVVAITLEGGQAVLVKRIIGLPGERIRIERGQVFVNDAPLHEPYVRYHVPWEIRDTALGNDEFFVIGDNRSMPERLHDFGRATGDRLMGRMIY